MLKHQQLIRGISYIALAIVFAVFSIVRGQENGMGYIIVGVVFAVGMLFMALRCFLAYRKARSAPAEQDIEQPAEQDDPPADDE